ncbi:MAG TPA: hypothetical protein VLM40_00600 [Gemmata sp.]|nr:hypothetical protein [Gemmata sp.]
MRPSLATLWRSAWLPWAVTAIVLVLGVPLFLRMPLWCDLTLYDVAAKNLLDGGVHYRDIFDTNLPGFVWMLTGIRAIFGFGAFQLRCVDLVVVAAVIGLVDRIAKRGGATPTTRAWAIAGATVLYLGSAEMVHAQRDVWMALPALGAVLLRIRRAGKGPLPAGEQFLRSAVEGVLWGAAVWIKPHCILMAGGMWLATARRLAGGARCRRVALAADFLGNIAGGAIAGLAGIAYLAASGAWPQFWEVITIWGPEYTALARSEFDRRIEQALFWFPPWSLWLVPSAILAVLSVVDAVPWRSETPDDSPGPVGRILPGWLWDKDAGSEARFCRAALATLYLVWAWQSLVIQRQYHYVHLTELLLMLGLWAAHRWAMPAIAIYWLAVTSAVWLAAGNSPALRESLVQIGARDSRPSEDPDGERYLMRYSLADPERLRLWLECWRTPLGGREEHVLWDQLARIRHHEATISWEELDEVAAFLRSRGIRDRELIAWHNSPHAIYLILGVKPGLRYLHAITFQNISDRAYSRVRAELMAAAGTARYAISDLELPAMGESPAERARILGPPSCRPHDLLPTGLPRAYRDVFPFNQPAVFRSRGGLGRYVMHELHPPLEDTKRPLE